MRNLLAAIEVLKVRRVEGGGNVRAFVDVRIGGITICGAKIIQQPGHQPWLAMPDQRWTDAAGKIRYAPVVELRASLKQRAAAAALVAWGGADGDSAA